MAKREKCIALGCENSPYGGGLCVQHHPSFEGESGEQEIETFTLPAGPAEGPGAEAALMESKRRCTETTKRGEPCKAWALKDDPLGRCPAHAGVALRHLDPVKAQQASAENRRRRTEARKKSAMDWVADKLEEHAEELVDAAIEAARRGDWRSVSWLFARVYGQPTEKIEHVKEPETVQQLRSMSREERRALLAQLERDGKNVIPLRAEEG